MQKLGLNEAENYGILFLYLVFMEADMGTLTLKAGTKQNASSSREYFLFHAMARSSSYAAFLDEVKRYNAEHPEGKISDDAEDKKCMKKSYQEFKSAVNTGFRSVENIDFDNPQVLRRLKNILQQQLPRETYKTMGDFASVPLTQADIGYTLLCHADGVKILGAKYLAQQKREEEKILHEQVVVGKSGITSYGSYSEDRVFSNQNTYKTQKEILVERMMQERRQNRK